MTSDAELLRQYSSEGNDAAFTEVVHRHTGLVYSAALRMVAGDAHLAQDVAQRVFCALANQAGPLSHRDNIVGWLYTSTHHSASTVVRSERRRKAREQIAFTMQEEPTRQEIDWSQLQPVLDEEVCRLGPADRDAVLLRFFQGKSHREVGEALGLSEDSARKRVERAIEKLRTSFTRRGLGVSSALLAETIAVNSVQAAPAGLAAHLASFSLANAGKVGVLSALGTALFFAMKTKTTVIVSLLIMSLLIIGAWQWSQPASEVGQPTASLATGVLKASPSLTPSANQRLGSGTMRGNQVQSPALPAVAASATGAGLADQRTDLHATMEDVLRLVASQDYATLALDYLPHKSAPKDPQAAGVPIGQPVQYQADDPVIQKLFQNYADMITAAKDAEPVFSADGRMARVPLAPDSKQTLVFAYIDGRWRISGVETAVPEGTPPPIRAVKKNPNPQGGGYVP